MASRSSLKTQAFFWLCLPLFTLHGNKHFHYDALDRLSAVHGPQPEHFIHDPAHNILAAASSEEEASQQASATQVDGNRLQFRGDTHYEYDLHGNRSAAKRGKNQSLQTRYFYNSKQQLIKIETSKSGQIEQSVHYAYDPLGRRISKQIAQHQEKNKLRDKRVAFLWNGDVLLQETSALGNGEQQHRTYYFEPGTFKPIALNHNGQLYHYHLGTPDTLTNEQGDIAWSVSYRSYGNVALAQVNDIDQPLRFQGQYFDEESGLHYNRFRYYDPRVGLFTQQDPIGLLGGINNYQYVPNPVHWIDPFGLNTEKEAPSVCPKSYAGRKKALDESQGEMTTLDAFTKEEATGQPWDKAADPSNWLEERQQLHQDILDAETKKALAKAKGQVGVPSIHAMRGNTGAGKSRLKKSGVIPELANDNVPTINPDDFKPTLINHAKDDGIDLTHNQVHWEASMLSDKLKKELLKPENRDNVESILVDKRLGSLREVEELGSEAADSGRKLNVFDVDAPLENSLLGVLLRKPGGDDPIVPFEVVLGGFEAARNNRKSIIKKFEDNPDLGRYELYGSTSDGGKKLVSVTENGETKVIDKEAYESLTSKADGELVDIYENPISDEAIDKLTKDLPESEFKNASIETLRANKGKTWKQAIDDHGKL